MIQHVQGNTNVRFQKIYISMLSAPREIFGNSQKPKFLKENMKRNCNFPVWWGIQINNLVWLFHSVFNFEKSCLLTYKRQVLNAEWSTIIDAFPERVPLTDLHNCSSDNQVFKIEIKKTRRGKVRILQDLNFIWKPPKPAQRALTERLI